MRAGNLDIREVSGSMDIGVLAGNLDISLPDPASVRHVDASVTTGGLTAKPWKVDKGGIGRSYEREGAGEFDLRARVLAGQLTIR
jgi:hypothetical protein